VSKASSGAMEVIDVYSTGNLMKFLDNAKENGWQVIGTALSGSSVRVDEMTLDRPTILVLGNEGHGIRTNILRRCDALVKIPSMISGGGSNEGSSSSSSSNADVDSLNVSVTGGILLHHILSAKSKSAL
jgi:21S rRNA (GM2251-2'-O)-methyltransferase